MDLRTRRWIAALAGFVLLSGCAASSTNNPQPPPQVARHPVPSPAGDAADQLGAKGVSLSPEPPAPPIIAAAPISSPRPQAAHPTPLTAPSHSTRLPNGLFNPMPAGFVAGYPADTGLDIAGFHRPVYALAAGTLVYSESGHTRWASDDRAVLLRLDEPIEVTVAGEDERGDRTGQITHLWYAHLSELRFHQSGDASEAVRVTAGELLGISGVANGSPHLHLGMLLDGVTDQRWGSFLLDDACREVLGGWRRGQRLPR